MVEEEEEGENDEVPKAEAVDKEAEAEAEAEAEEEEEEKAMLCKELLQAHSQVHTNAPLLPRSTRSRRPLLWWVSDEEDEEDADNPPTPTVWASNCSQLYFFKISSCTFRISSCTAGYPASRVPNNSFTGRPFCTPRVGMGRCL